MPDGFGPCGQGCGQQATEVVVTVNDWLIDVCHTHALEACDPLASLERAR